MKHMLENAG